MKLIPIEIHYLIRMITMNCTKIMMKQMDLQIIRIAKLILNTKKSLTN
jgi:hypothetical protein